MPPPQPWRVVTPRSEPQAALGKAIRELRETRGPSQEQPAIQADTHPTWISQLESARNNPSWGTVQRISAALGVAGPELASRAERLEASSD